MAEGSTAEFPSDESGRIAEIEHLDVLIVGAGISGIDVAYHLQRRCPGKSWLILEARDRIGGTWDLFRYPGVRSDSDMYTLGFPFRPWTGDQAIVGGPAIRAYVEETAQAQQQCAYALLLVTAPVEADRLPGWESDHRNWPPVAESSSEHSIPALCD